MPTLHFVFSWLEESVRVWSGTPRGLYDAFSKKVAMRKLNVGTKDTNTIAKYMTDIFFPTKNLAHAKRIINKDSAPAQDPYFVFGEYNTNVVKQTFCYQDLSIDYSINMIKNQPVPRSVARKIKRAIDLHALKRKRKEAARFYENCAGIFTMSAWLKEYMVHHMGIDENKVHHVGGGCSIDVSKIDASRKTGNKFLFVGKDWSIKNGDLVVQAFEALSQRHPELNPELYIAGPVTPPPSVVNKKGVHFLGLLSYEELTNYYNTCDYFVMPSNIDAYGLVFVEALIFGLPCIGKNVHAMPEFISDGENGYLIQDNDIDQLVTAMENLLLNGQSIRDHVKAQHACYVDQYSWDSVTDRILTVMENEGYSVSTK